VDVDLDVDADVDERTIHVELTERLRLRRRGLDERPIM